jgi:hypothetical protein
VKFVLPIAACALAYAVWRWAPMLLDPLGLSEFLFVGRLCSILAALTAAESAYRKVLP